VALGGLLLSGCASPKEVEATGSVVFDPNQAMTNPKDYEGPSTANLNLGEIVPVSQAPTPKLPVTVTDSGGDEVTVNDVSRILALDIYGTTSQIVYGLGLGDNVVGRDTSSDFPGIKDKPRVTQNGNSLSAEAILELAPTVIITDTSLGPFAVIEQMREAGIAVVLVSSERSLESMSDLIKEIAGSLGLPEQGEALAKRSAEAVDQAKATIAKAVPEDAAMRLRIIFLYVRGEAGIYYVFGKDSGTDSLIEAVGGIDVAGEVGWDGMRPVTDEGLVAMNPDLILMMTNGLDSVGGVDGLLERLPAIAATPAGQRRRVVDMDDTQILAFGPSTNEVLLAMAAAIYTPDPKP